MYPGAFQFTFELSRGLNKGRQLAATNVSVLTARAKEFKFALALKPRFTSLTYSLTHSLTYLLTYSLTHLTSLTHSLTYLLTHSLTYLFIYNSDKICAGMRRTGEKGGVRNWGIGDVYYGSVVEWVIQSRKGIPSHPYSLLPTHSPIHSPTHSLTY